MAKREKVIVMVMAVVVAYGLYDFLSSSKPKTETVTVLSSVADTRQFIADVARSLKDDAVETDRYIIRQAKTEWRRDPFWHKVHQPENRPDTVVESSRAEKPQESRIYTGYLEMGEQTLAIIDGAEYEPGDELGKGGPVVQSINPNQVILSVPGARDKIILPLKETR